MMSFSANTKVTLSKEKKLKAAYLFNFTRFIEWPNNGANKQPSSIHICIDDSKEFYQFLHQMVSSRAVDKSQGEVKVLQLEQAFECDLLYVTSTQKNVNVNANLSNTVIIVDSNEVVFPEQSMAFYKEKGRLRFEIDLEKIKSLDITFSSELLKLARIK